MCWEDGGVRPTLVPNPVTDRGFVSYAEGLVDEARLSMAEFEARLRVRYPRAAVHARELAGERITVWYVYRDGRWTDPRGPGEGADAR